MELMMCTGCGTFVHAAPSETDGAADAAADGGGATTADEGEDTTESDDESDARTLEPMVEECPECGGTTFKTT
jgi:hypothetical protein